MNSSFDVGLDFEAAKNCLVVVVNAASLDVRFDFHTCLLLWMLTLNIERRRRVPGFEAGRHCRSHVQAKTSGGIADMAEIFFIARAL
jgi:hypothetical protein